MRLCFPALLFYVGLRLPVFFRVPFIVSDLACLVCTVQIKNVCLWRPGSPSSVFLVTVTSKSPLRSYFTFSSQITSNRDRRAITVTVRGFQVDSEVTLLKFPSHESSFKPEATDSDTSDLPCQDALICRSRTGDLDIVPTARHSI